MFLLESKVLYVLTPAIMPNGDARLSVKKIKKNKKNYCMHTLVPLFKTEKG